jgi:hypothetical protein
MRTQQWTVMTIAVVVLGTIVPQAGLAGGPGETAASARIQVTGDPTPIETIRAALLATAQDVVPEARDAQVTLSQITPPLQPLPAATGATLRAVLQLAPSGGARHVARTVPVEITHQVAPWSNTQRLLLSNSPESVTFSTVLFSTALGPAEAVRLLYHHQNGSARRMTVTVAISNPTPRRATLWVTGAVPNAGADELVIGHAAARDFLTQYWRRAGFLFSIPGHTTSPMFVHALAPGGIASGLVRLAPVEDPPLVLQVIARVEGDLDPPSAGYLPVADRVHQRGIFERPVIERRHDYVAGGPFAMMTLGADQDLLHERDSGEALQGNYGVLYTFPVRIHNPAPAPVTLVLEMHAVGGQAGGVFRLDDRIVDVPRVPAGGVLTVATVRIAPGEDRLLVVSTMPESGANYPVLLTLGRQQ